MARRGNPRREAAIALAAIVALFATGCASRQTSGSIADPIEPTNRAMLRVNDAIDRHALKPIADTYRAILPAFVRAGVSNFFSNIADINIGLNNFLQGKPRDGLSDWGRVLSNTLIGVGGLFDPATGMGLEKHREDFGQTFAVWGAGSGPYLVLPFFGPSNLRDAAGGLLTMAIGGVYFGSVDATLRITLSGVRAVNARSDAEANLRAVEDSAVDRYIFIREGYTRSREFQIHDGDPPVEENLDLKLFEGLDLEEE